MLDIIPDGPGPVAIFMATALSAAIATICMAFFANYPVALASKPYIPYIKAKVFYVCFMYNI